jgi:hypothetical protein
MIVFSSSRGPSNTAIPPPTVAAFRAIVQWVMTAPARDSVNMAPPIVATFSDRVHSTSAGDAPPHE